MIFGLTGGIACGKSTVSKTFQKHGIPMVDADVVARQIVEPGTLGLELITRAFGKDYLNEDGTLNRTKLGGKVFEDRISRYLLDFIMAPLLKAESAAQLNKLAEQGHALVGYDAALICEMRNADKYRPLVVVACAPETQLARLMSRNSLTKEQAMSRITSQMSVEQKVKIADFVIRTDGSIEESIVQTENVIQKLKEYNETNS
jgi:dephospho-CoA kinase